MSMETEIRAFSERHLAPYSVRGDELIPEYCPICHGGDNHDKHTFALNLTDGVYVCKRGSCGARGRFEELAQRFGERAEFIRPAAKAKKQFVLPQVEIHPLTDAILAYFERRRISPATLNAFGVGADGSGNILFPFRRDGELVYVKYRAPRKPVGKERKEWQAPGTQPILFGMDLCSFAQPLIVTEGQCFPPDAEILTQNGWVRFDQYDGRSCVMSVDNQMQGKWVIPLAIVKKYYEGNLLACRIGGNYSSIVTPDHNIVFLDRKSNVRKIPAQNAKRNPKQRIPTTIHVDGPGIPLTNEMIALYLAVSADGTIDVRKSGVRHTRIAVKKERKYLRLKAMLDKLNIVCSSSEK